MNQYDNKFKNEYIKLVYRYRLLKLKDSEICELFNINKTTFWRWKKRYKEFKEAYDNGGKKADSEIAEKLHENALGFVKDEEIVTPTGKKVQTKKFYKQETKAQQYWLKNRSPGFDEELKLKKAESAFRRELARKELEHKIWLDKEKLELEKLKHNKEQDEKENQQKIDKFLDAILKRDDNE